VDLSLFLGEKLVCADMDGHAPARPRTLGCGGGDGGQPMVLGSFPQALLDTVIGACATRVVCLLCITHCLHATPRGSPAAAPPACRSLGWCSIGSRGQTSLLDDDHDATAAHLGLGWGSRLLGRVEVCSHLTLELKAG
jgi:hypothetical protein